MTETERLDAAWKQAVDWLMREHDECLDDAARDALYRWLAEEPTHRQAYKQARDVWLITGLVPTRDERGDPPSGDHE